MFLKKLLPVSLHLWLHFFPTFPLPFCPFISLLLSILSLYFLLLSFVLTLLLPILFSINLIYFFNLIHIFPHRKLSSLSLSLLSFRGFLLFLITLIKIDDSFLFSFLRCVFFFCFLFLFLFFLISHLKVFSFPFITLIKLWFGLIYT